MINMNKEEFLLALNKEGLLIYGTTWLENFKRLQELKKYKEMWEELVMEYEIPQEPEDVKYTRRSILNKIKRIADKYYLKSGKNKDIPFIETENKYRVMWKRAKRVFQFRGYHRSENYYIKFMEELEQKHFPKPKECEEVLILTIKGKSHEVNNVIFNIEHVFRNSAHVNVKRGTKAENV